MMLGQLSARLGQRKAMTPDAVDALRRFRFPGNVRQLWNIVERAFVTGKTALIDLEDLPAEVTEIATSGAVAPTGLTIAPSNESRSLKETLQSIEAQLLREALEKYGTQTLAAKHLGVTQPTIARKTRQYRLSD
jgi:transcriptional regulator with PAS, ATPase and Fis domain